jgi:hypothetical protein
MTHNCAYVRQHYQVPAEVGRRIIAYEKPGVILLIAAITSVWCWMKIRRNRSATITQLTKCNTARWRKGCL